MLKIYCAVWWEEWLLRVKISRQPLPAVRQPEKLPENNKSVTYTENNSWQPDEKFNQMMNDCRSEERPNWTR